MIKISRKAIISINFFVSEWPFKAAKFYTFSWNNLADFDAGIYVDIKLTKTEVINTDCIPCTGKISLICFCVAMSAA